jgi:hypothetical protein
MLFLTEESYLLPLSLLLSRYGSGALRRSAGLLILNTAAFLQSQLLISMQRHMNELTG